MRGNARELENVIERALALCEGESLDIGDIPLPWRDERVGDPGAAGLPR